MMTDQAYIAAYQTLVAQYSSNQASMSEHLTAVQALKDKYLKGRTGAKLPLVP